jgi:hypothetical protein
MQWHFRVRIRLWNRQFNKKTRMWIRIHLSPDPDLDPAFSSTMIQFGSGSGLGSGLTGRAGSRSRSRETNLSSVQVSSPHHELRDD